MTGEVINTPERFAKWERDLPSASSVPKTPRASAHSGRAIKTCAIRAGARPRRSPIPSCSACRTRHVIQRWGTRRRQCDG